MPASLLQLVLLAKLSGPPSLAEGTTGRREGPHQSELFSTQKFQGSTNLWIYESNCLRLLHAKKECGRSLWLRPSSHASPGTGSGPQKGVVVVVVPPLYFVLKKEKKKNPLRLCHWL